MPVQKVDINEAEKAIRRAKRSLTSVFAFSFVVSLLLLTSPLFMLQVYDRVLLSRSESTLLGLLGVACFLLITLWFVELTRNLLINRISVRFNNDIAKTTFSEVMSRGTVSKPLQDMASIRSFLNAPYLLSLFDIPWLPAYLAFAYFLHPMLGHIGLVGAVILFIFAVINDKSTKALMEKSSEFYGAANKFSEHSSRHHDAIVGMGMVRNLTSLWGQFQQAGLGFQMKAADKNAWISSAAKVIRQIIQVSVLAMGGYLAIQDITSPGAMIAASIIIGRALAPIEQSIQGWRLFSGARESYASLREFFDSYEPSSAGVSLPVPKGEISLQNVISLGSSGDEVRSAATPRPVIKNVTMKVEAGTALGVTGPSGSGKSTLIRLILGILKPLSGTVRIDGAELTTEVQRQYSAYCGFVPQEVGIFDGTVAENIARFAEVSDEKVIKAAQLAGAHELILSLPEGYETQIGEAGIHLSGGQKQRIALARAVYDEPSIVVLDEPASNLDKDGTAALLQCIEQLKAMNKTVVLIAHQPSLFKSVDQIALVVDGQIQDMGPRDEMFKAMGAKRAASDAKPAQPDLQKKPNAVSEASLSGSSAHFQQDEQAPRANIVSTSSVAKQKAAPTVVKKPRNSKVTIVSRSNGRPVSESDKEGLGERTNMSSESEEKMIGGKDEADKVETIEGGEPRLEEKKA